MKTLYVWLRDLHLYVGMVISPLVLLFALSVVVLNHPSSEGQTPPAAATVAKVRVPPGIEKLQGMARVMAAREMLDQLGVAGEIGFVGYDERRQILTLPVARPGRETVVRISLADGRAIIERSPWRLSGAVNWLHKMPGPHNVAIRGNWGPTRTWRWGADALVFLLMFVTASGIYLWAVLKAERTAGLALIALGALSFTGIVYALL